jgi:TonB family protein
MRDSLLHLLNIVSLAGWTSVSGFAALALWVVPAVPEIVMSNGGPVTSLGADFSVGESVADSQGETGPSDGSADTLEGDRPALPSPPELPRRQIQTPLPSLPNLPRPERSIGAGSSMANWLAAGDMPGPSYPPYSKRNRQSGTVVVQFSVDATGKVVAASIYTSSNWPLLDQEALRTVRGWQFPPGQTVTLIRPIDFKLP